MSSERKLMMQNNLEVHKDTGNFKLNLGEK